MKLNIGAGSVPVEGFTPVDIKNGQTAYPLSVEDGSVDEIRASHVLEHFPHGQVSAVIADWFRALKPGGTLKIAVPDFQKIAEQYLAGEDVNVQGYVMGGQTDAHDFHRTVFDAECLTEALQDAGFTDIEPWTSEVEDCAALPISLNLSGRKPRSAVWLHYETRKPKIAAAMSVPRLGFMDNFFCAYQSLMPLRIPLRKHTGAFWGQCLERCIEQCIEDEGCDWILTIDYDTIFTRSQIEALIQLASRTEYDAIAPLQMHRTKDTPLFTLQRDGEAVDKIDRSALDNDLVQITTAHFGCTLLRVDALQRMRRPWFHSAPDGDGRWGEGRVDDDVRFWRQWAQSGNTLALAPRVAVGHCELMVRWPDINLGIVHQHPSEFYSRGIPEEVWK